MGGQMYDRESAMNMVNTGVPPKTVASLQHFAPTRTTDLCPHEAVCAHVLMVCLQHPVGQAGRSYIWHASECECSRRPCWADSGLGP